MNEKNAPYLQEVFKHTDAETVLYFDEFDRKNVKEYKNTCNINGFRGTYGISNSETGRKERIF